MEHEEQLRAEISEFHKEKEKMRGIVGETEAQKGCEAEPIEVDVSYRLSTVAAK